MPHISASDGDVYHEPSVASISYVQLSWTPTCHRSYQSIQVVLSRTCVSADSNL